MNDRQAFARLAGALSPWHPKLVFIGGWAHRLYRLHPSSQVQSHAPLATLDADVAFAEGEKLEGSMNHRLRDAGFIEQLTGNHHPPISQYALGEDIANGFYAEFLTPLSGSGLRRNKTPYVTVENAGVTAQRLRHLEILLQSPWQVTLDEEWLDAQGCQLQIPNPVSFIVQKLLIHDRRPDGKKAQDLLYIHDALQLFNHELDLLKNIWEASILPAIHSNQVDAIVASTTQCFGHMSDRLRDAAVIPQDRELDPERMRQSCHLMLGEILGICVP